MHHKNHDKSDNRVTNLEWVTHTQNIEHAVAADRFYRDGKHAAAKLSRADVEELRRTAGQFTRQEHAERFRVHPSAIDDAISGRTHASVATPASGKPVSSICRGETHLRSKLNTAEVLEIVQRCNAGDVAEKVATDYPVTATNIRKIMQGETWARLTGIQRKEARAREDSWEAGVQACRDWCSVHKLLASVKVEDAVGGFPLGAWVDRRRQDYKNGELSKTRQRILEKLGIVWSPHAAQTELGLAAAGEWAATHGDLCGVPISAVIDGFRLGSWLGTQRTVRNKLRREKSRPSPRQAFRFSELSKLGIDWRPKRGPKAAQS